MQAENRDQMKNKLRNKFLEATTNKKSENSSSNSQELDDSLNSFLQVCTSFFRHKIKPSFNVILLEMKSHDNVMFD